MFDVTTVSTVILAFLLVLAAVVDFRKQVIPDELNASLFVAGSVHAGVFEHLGAVFVLGPAVLAGSLALAVRYIYRKARKIEGLGLGDVKFLAASGPWVGFFGLPWVLLAASISGLVFALGQQFASGKFDAKERMPFGPHLAFGLFCTWILKIQHLL